MRFHVRSPHCSLLPRMASAKMIPMMIPITSASSSMFSSFISERIFVFVQPVLHALLAFSVIPCTSQADNVFAEQIHDAWCITVLSGMLQFRLHPDQKIIQTNFSNPVPVALHIQPSSSSSAAMHIAQPPLYLAQRSFLWSAVWPKALKMQTLTPAAGFRMQRFISARTSNDAVFCIFSLIVTLIISNPIQIPFARFIVVQHAVRISSVEDAAETVPACAKVFQFFCCFDRVFFIKPHAAPRFQAVRASASSALSKNPLTIPEHLFLYCSGNFL